jgi:prepilin-type N-terminal cleavage/methylation domain-containing protein
MSTYLHNSKKNGFTLVETLVAISILMISIVGPMYSIYRALQATYISRDELAATGLAQEGAEYVRNVRDSNYLATLGGTATPWLQNLSNCQTINGCTVDTFTRYSSTPQACSTVCTPLYINVGGQYTQQVGGTKTHFTRTVTITNPTSIEAIVNVKVSWITNHVTYSVIVNEHLYNWL